MVKVHRRFMFLALGSTGLKCNPEKRSMSRSPVLAAMLFALVYAAPVMAAGGLSHEEAASPSGGLTLDHGRKWATDAPLRQGMTAIGNDLRAALGPVHDKRYTAEDFNALAASITGHMNIIAQQCKLPEAVDAQLHIVLADLFAATDIMKAKVGDPAKGVIAAMAALDRYQAHFDHPGWKSVGH